MAHVTFIARATDGLVLVETWDDNNKVSSQVKNQAKQLLKKLHSGPSRCSVEGVGDFVFHYISVTGVCYLALFDRSYPKNFAFAFLEEIQKLFSQELLKEYGNSDHRSRIETIEKPYAFIKFDRQITKKKAEYKDTNSSKALNRLNENLTEVSSIMRQNIDDIINRGENLESVGRKASDLKNSSAEFKKTAKMLSFQTMVQKYGIPALIGLVVLLVVYFKFFTKKE